MTEIKAWQHIYAYLEYSELEALIHKYHGEVVNIAHHKAGWKPFLYSLNGLSKELAEDMVARTKYKVAPYLDGQKPQKYQFYGLPDGRFAISRIVPLPEKIITRRIENNYFCHTLILDEEAFYQIDCNPFHLIDLDPSPFYDDIIPAIEDAIQNEAINDRVNLRTGNIPPRLIKLPSPFPSVALHESTVREQQLRLGWLAMNATHIKDKRLYLAVIGQHEEILAIIRRSFELIPPSKRVDCWFDTGFEECHPAMTPVWLAGFAQTPPTNFSYTAFAADLNAIPLLDDLPNRPQTYFERWWEDCLQRGESERLQKEWHIALALQQIASGKFDQNDKQQLTEMSSEELEAYPRLSQKLVQEQAHQLTRKGFPPSIVKIIYENSAQDLKTQWLLLTGEINWSEASQWLYEHYEEQISLPTKTELRIIQQAIKNSDNQSLKILLLFWNRRGNRWQNKGELSHEWQEWVGNLPNSSYYAWLQRFFRHPALDPQDLFVPGKGELFFYFLLSKGRKSKLYTDLFGPRYLRGAPLTRWILKLIDWREGKALDLLADHITGLPILDKWRVKRKLMRTKQVSAPKLLKALGGQVETTAPQSESQTESDHKTPE